MQLLRLNWRCQSFCFLMSSPTRQQMSAKSNLVCGRSDVRAARNIKGEIVYVFSDYKPATYPNDVVNYRQIIIHEELPEDTCRGSDLHVLVRRVNSPSEFWINLYGEEYWCKLLALCKEMSRFYEERHEKYLLPSYAVVDGQFCVCIYRNEWYRAKIVNAADKDLVDVFLIDCGSTITLNVDNLRFMHKNFSHLPMQSFRADIADIKPRNSAEWPLSVCEFFRQETTGRKFCAKVVDVFRKRHSVSLILLDVNGNSVSQKLVSNKMAEVEIDLESADGLTTRNKEPPESSLGGSFVKVENIIGIPDDIPSPRPNDCSQPEDGKAGSRSADTAAIVDHKDVNIAGKKLLLVTIRDQYYFILSDFLHAFAVVHEHVVLKLLETFPTQVVVEKMDYKELRVLLEGLKGRRVRGLTHLADRGVIPSVHLLPINVACELLAFLGIGGNRKNVLRSFVSSLT